LVFVPDVVGGGEEREGGIAIEQIDDRVAPRRLRRIAFGIADVDVVGRARLRCLQRKIVAGQSGKVIERFGDRPRIRNCAAA
jgi:hypothetical protein